MTRDLAALSSASQSCSNMNIKVGALDLKLRRDETQGDEGGFDRGL